MNSPIEYLIAFCLQSVMTCNAMLTSANNISLLFSAYTMLSSLINEIKNELDSINDNLNTRKQRSTTYTQLGEFIELHSSVKQLSELNP